MPYTTQQATALFQALASLALESGVFDRVNTHEPANTPGRGISCTITLAVIAPTSASGLASVSGVITFTVRIWTAMDQRPLDAVDPNLLGAMSAYAGALAGGFTVNGTARNVDLFRMRAQAAYVLHEGKEMRVVDLTVPVIVNDLWTEVP